ncbi:hypothetical protein [Achromobacter pestifer]|uniref:hypothetical protein n=1 Tax=Achromobacter pestifer TaxID=1353889 RepID=UPI001582BCB0|nr:hypothetical protein [Achromobacter pestifer]
MPDFTPFADFASAAFAAGRRARGLSRHAGFSVVSPVVSAVVSPPVSPPASPPSGVVSGAYPPSAVVFG